MYLAGVSKSLAEGMCRFCGIRPVIDLGLFILYPEFKSRFVLKCLRFRQCAGRRPDLASEYLARLTVRRSVLSVLKCMREEPRD
jgi:hypothetical protein